MYRNPDYTLCDLAGVSYLLPQGQAVADLRRGIRLNETGVLIWELLGELHDMEDLILSLLDHFEIPADSAEASTVRQDLTEYLTQLQDYGVITGIDPRPNLSGSSSEDAPGSKAQSEEASPCFASLENASHLPARDYRIGGLWVRIQCDPALLSHELMDFQIEEKEAGHADCYDKATLAEPALTLTIQEGARLTPAGGRYLLRNPELCVYETKEAYLLFFPRAKGLHSGRITGDGRKALLLYEREGVDASDLIYYIFHGIRHCYLYRARFYGRYALHSASLLYRDKVYLFSGRSGTGKSTHTNLWHELFQVPVINGDLNLMAQIDGKPMVLGIPWCGTSEIYDPKDYPLGAITFLKQAKEDGQLPLSESEGMLMLYQRLVTSLWNEDMLRSAISYVTELSSSIPVYYYGCKPCPSAAYGMRDLIDADITQ